MYEEIPEIPQYLELQEIPTEAGIQPPKPVTMVTITATGETGGGKRVAMLVTLGALTCIITI